jgi:hypothetical protein
MVPRVLRVHLIVRRIAMMRQERLAIVSAIFIMRGMDQRVLRVQLEHQTSK